MAGYVIAEIGPVTDRTGMDEYRSKVDATIEHYGGRFLVRGGETQALEGGWQPGRMVVIQFESAERAHDWYASSEYVPLRELRQRCAGGKLLIVEGV